MLDTILVGIMMLTTLGVVGLFYYTEKVYVKPPVDEKKESESFFRDQEARLIPILFKVDKMLIGLSSNDKKPNARMHYLEIEPHLVLFKEEQKGIAKAYLPMLQDKIISLASKMDKDDLVNLTGKILLEDRLIRGINLEMKKSTGEALVKNIYFARYTLQ